MGVGEGNQFGEGLGRRLSAVLADVPVCRSRVVGGGVRDYAKIYVIFISKF
jgi:hypothetical protein